MSSPPLAPLISIKGLAHFGTRSFDSITDIVLAHHHTIIVGFHFFRFAAFAFRCGGAEKVKRRALLSLKGSARLYFLLFYFFATLSFLGDFCVVLLILISSLLLLCGLVCNIIVMMIIKRSKGDDEVRMGPSSHTELVLPCWRVIAARAAYFHGEKRSDRDSVDPTTMVLDSTEEILCVGLRAALSITFHISIHFSDKSFLHSEADSSELHVECCVVLRSYFSARAPIGRISNSNEL